MNLNNFIKKYLVFFLLILSFCAGSVSQYVRIKGHKENDHWVYYRTAKRIDKQNIKEIYTLKDGALPFRYAPPTLMLISWMSNFEELDSRRIWLVTQSFFILISLYLLYLILLELNSPAPLNSVAFSFFLFYRYFLDALFCGQVTGFIFLGFTLALYFWINGQKKLSNASILFLSLLKIVPGFMVMINFLDTKNWREFVTQILNLLLVLLLIHGLYFLWFIVKFGQNNIGEFFPMFKTWITIALADQDYFDGSTLKSQALRGVILRYFGESKKSEFLWMFSSFIILLSVFVFWYKQKMKSIKIRLYSYLLGLLVYVLIMPESLPYQIFKLLIPLVFLMNEFISTSKKQIGLLLFFILIFCSLSTTDLTGHVWADWIQYISLPFFTFIFMGELMRREIYIDSRHDLN